MKSFQEALLKAQAIVEKHKEINQPKRTEKAKKIHVASLPKIDNKDLNEKDVNEYIKVLRMTSHGIGKVLLDERKKEKAEKKELKQLTNINFVKQKLHEKGNERKHSVRKKIQQMRKDRIFPQPKSFSNYKKRNGFLNKIN